MPPNALLRWSMEPADCTSLRQVEAGALHKAKTDEWLSDIQVQASGVGCVCGGVSGSSLFCAQFPVSCADVCSANVGQYSYGLCAGFGGAAKTGLQVNLTGRSKSLGKDYSRRIILHKKWYPGQAFGQSSSLQEQGSGWDSVESDRPGSLSWQTNV